MIKSTIIQKNSSSKTAAAAILVTMLFLVIGSASYRQVYGQDQPTVGTVRVITHVINSHGGTKQASDFSNCIDSSRGEGSINNQCSSGDDQGSTQNSFDPGPYKVTPNDIPSGYTASYSGDCSGVVNSGEIKTCTITYDDVATPSQTLTNNSSSGQ
ncbi:MAG: hypothetical protein JO297_16640 [Nitrososphaeraceae archaeon]|nr:hypothetical protein [Nitrososphaeraceae archaeon]